jgi:hypothetical protein
VVRPNLGQNLLIQRSTRRSISKIGEEPEFIGGKHQANMLQIKINQTIGMKPSLPPAHIVGQ